MWTHVCCVGVKQLWIRNTQQPSREIGVVHEYVMLVRLWLWHLRDTRPAMCSKRRNKWENAGHSLCERMQSAATVAMTFLLAGPGASCRCLCWSPRDIWEATACDFSRLHVACRICVEWLRGGKFTQPCEFVTSWCNLDLGWSLYTVPGLWRNAWVESYLWINPCC